MRLDLGRGHAFVVVPSGIVLAHMRQAEPMILVQRIAGFRCAVLAGRGAARSIAGARRVVGTGLGLFAAAGHQAVMETAAGGGKPRATAAGHLFLPFGMRQKAAMQDSRAERIRAALLGTFAPAEVQVQDDSAQHAGHAGARPGGETHYSVRVVSPAFAGQSRVVRSRAAHAALEAEFGTGLHALALRLLTPEEAARGA